jgi:hypothetical protein
VDITDTRSSPRAATAVSALYAGHALGLIRLPVLLVGDRASAEDVVQDAFRPRFGIFAQGTFKPLPMPGTNGNGAAGPDPLNYIAW